MKNVFLAIAALCFFVQVPAFANDPHAADKKATPASEVKKDDKKVAETCEKCHKAKAECHCKKESGKKG